MFGIEFTKEQRLVLYVLIGLSAIGLTYNHAHNASSASSEVVLREPGQGGTPRVTATDSDTMPNTNQTLSGNLVVHMVGCVNKPGIYKLPAGSRIIDAIGAAGGSSQGADLQSINLAAKIEDGSRICVPSTQQSRGVSPNPRAVATRALAESGQRAWSSSTGGKFKTPGEGLVHINSAGVDDLQQLPGVGPVTAEKILDYRRQIGKFARPEQLMDVKGIGPKKFEKMRPFVTL